MKKNCRILTAMLLVLIGLCSCSDEDNQLSTAGQISFYGEKYLLEQGAIYHDNNHSVIAVSDYTFEDRYQGEDGKEHIDLVEGFTADIKGGQTGNFMIGLYEHGFVLSDLTKDARGKGACICLLLASPEVDQLVPGKYTYSLNHDEYTFKGYSSANYTSGESVVPNELASGEVNISREGDIYTVAFKCGTSFGGLIEGTYTGNLKTFDIQRKIGLVNFYKNIKLEALFDKVEYTDLDGVFHSEPDYLRATSFLRSTKQLIYTAELYRYTGTSNKNEIDIALAYDKTNEAIYFESPIKMSALLWHNTLLPGGYPDDTYELPCHTKYMPAPRDFTDEDFEALSEPEDFVLDFSESKASIPIGSKTPCFVFAQTGNGLMEVIRINKIIPESTEMIGGVIYPVNPSINIDIKYPRSLSEQQIR